MKSERVLFRRKVPEIILRTALFPEGLLNQLKEVSRFNKDISLDLQFQMKFL